VSETLSGEQAYQRDCVPLREADLGKSYFTERVISYRRLRIAELLLGEGITGALQVNHEAKPKYIVGFG
jgi:hypothetical protein